MSDLRGALRASDHSFDYGDGIERERLAEIMGAESPQWLRAYADALEAEGAICLECGATTTDRNAFMGWCPHCGAEAPYALPLR